MLFSFHNSVNARKNYKPMNKSELDATYANFNTIAVAREFMYYYKDRHRSMKLLADDMLRSKLAINIQNWFNDFYKYCEP
jgi:hemerythrin superfamily protein